MKLNKNAVKVSPKELSEYFYCTNGVVYFDNTGLMNSTTSPGSGITTSNYILTTQPGTNVPVWTSTIDGGEY
jgi:hypothetical protein